MISSPPPPPADYINVTSFIDGYKILLPQEGKVTDLVSGSVCKHLHWRDCRERGMRSLREVGVHRIMDLSIITRTRIQWYFQSYTPLQHALVYTSQV